MWGRSTKQRRSAMRRSESVKRIRNRLCITEAPKKVRVRTAPPPPRIGRKKVVSRRHA